MPPRAQIYNEEINDLLEPSKKNLAVRESSEQGFFVDKLTERTVSSAPAVLQIIEEGQARRTVGATKMNEKSSRSHTILQVVRSCRKSAVRLLVVLHYPHNPVVPKEAPLYFVDGRTRC